MTLEELKEKLEQRSKELVLERDEVINLGKTERMIELNGQIKELNEVLEKIDELEEDVGKDAISDASGRYSDKKIFPRRGRTDGSSTDDVKKRGISRCS